jgi:hypothetical protein
MIYWLKMLESLAAASVIVVKYGGGARGPTL